MKIGEQFRRSSGTSVGDLSQIIEKSKKERSVSGTAPFIRELTFSEFLLASPLAKSEMVTTRDYVVDREIEIHP